VNISERHVKIQIYNIVNECRKHVYNPKDCADLPKAFNDARSKLEGISLLFPNGTISRYIKVYSDELAQLRVIVGVDGSGTVKASPEESCCRLG
jgi:hypothetical protein